MDWNPSQFKVLGIWLTNNIKDCVAINFNEKFEETKKLFFTVDKKVNYTSGKSSNFEISDFVKTHPSVDPTAQPATGIYAKYTKNLLCLCLESKTG